MTSLRERLGVALQRQRQVHGLSQTQLATLAKLSLKYIGEIGRGEANVSMEALERITNALEWDPFELPLREQDTLPEGVRTLLLAELTHMQHLVQTAISWVRTLDAAMVRRAAQPEPPTQSTAWSEEPPIRPIDRARRDHRRRSNNGPPAWRPRGQHPRAGGRPMGVECRIDFGYENGKRVRRSFYGATRAEVADQLVKVVRAKQQGVTTSPSRQTTKAYLVEWLEQAQARLKPRTYADYKLMLEKHVIPHIGTMPVTKLTPQRLQSWLRALQADGVSANRRKYARTVLRAALKQATRWQLLAVNPATLVEVPRHERAEIQPLDLEQAQRLLKAARGILSKAS
jgi:transcriptional regulator with XRE-family HTH domain